MTTVLPTEVSYGTVEGKLIKAVVDSGDDDNYPDSVPVLGTVTFTPRPAVIISASSHPPVTIIPQATKVTLDSTGAFSVNLIATDDPDLNPTDWTYVVSFNLIGVKYGSFDMAVPAGEVTNIVTAIPILSNSGNPTVIGPAGPNNLIVSPTEPINPYTGLVWIDTS